MDLPFIQASVQTVCSIPHRFFMYPRRVTASGYPDLLRLFPQKRWHRKQFPFGRGTECVPFRPLSYHTFCYIDLRDMCELYKVERI